MSRPTGTRDHPELYEKIIGVLAGNERGMKAYEISQELKENDCTCRTYLADLVEQGRVVRKKITGRKGFRYMAGPAAVKAGAIKTTRPAKKKPN